jgi:hypothetical protein
MPQIHSKRNALLSFLQRNSFLLFNALCIFFVLFIIFRTLSYHYALILHPYQLQYREGVTLLMAEKMMAGENPYSIDNHPYWASVYGVMYHVFSFPFAKLFGNTFLAHRLVSAFWGLCCAGLVAWILKRQHIMLVYCLAGGAIVYSSLLYHKTLTAEPDSLGLFCFLFALYICHEANFSVRSLFIAAVLSLLGFYTKIYFILGIPVLCSYLFLFRSKSQGIIYSILVLLFCILFLIVGYLFIPSFFVFLFNPQVVANQGYDLGYSVFQMKSFIELNIGLLAVGLLLLCLSLLKYLKINKENTSFPFANKPSNSHKKEIFSYINITDWNKPFLIGSAINLYTYTFFVTLFIVSFVIGGSIGAYLYYHFTFLTPFLVIVILSATKNQLQIDISLNQYKTVQMNGQSLFIILVMMGVLSLFLNKGKLKSISNQEIADWEKARTYIKEHKNILNTPSVTNFMQQEGKKNYDNGHIEYLVSCKDKSMIAWLQSDLTALNQKTKNYKQEISNKIANKEFDLIMLDGGSTWHLSENDLQKNYQKVDSLCLVMPHIGHRWNTTYWKPKP